MAYDFNGAIKAGVPLNEITDYVAGKADYDLAGARDAGISDKDILGHLGVNVGPAKPEQSSIGAGWKTAWQQLPQLGYGLAGAAAATLESMAGEGGMATAAKDWSVKGYQDWGSKIQLNAKDNYEFDTAYDKAKNGDFGALVDWMGYGLGYVAGQGVQMLGTAGVGSLVGKAALKGVAESFAAKAVETSTKEILAAQATKGLTQEAARKLAVQQVAGEFGQTAAIGASAFGMEGGEIGGDIAEKSVREGRVLTGSELAQAFGATILAGSLEFVGDKIGLSGMTGKLPFGKAASEMGGFGGRAARGLIGGTMAAPAEFATEYGQTLAEEWGKGNDPFSDDAKRQALNAGALGAMGGSVHGVGGGLISAPRKVDPISEIETSPTVAGAIDKMTQAVDEANLNLTAATDSYLAPPAAPEIPPAAPVSEGPLTGPNETWRNTLDAASTGLT